MMRGPPENSYKSSVHRPPCQSAKMTDIRRPERKLWTFPLAFALWTTTFGSSFVFGYSVGCMNAPAQLIKEWIRNESYPAVHGKDITESRLTEIWSWMVAGCTLTSAIGGLLCGYAADKLGRKRAMMVNGVITITGSLLMGISKTTNMYFLLLAGRLIIGVSCGINSGVAPIYLTEIAPLRLRGMLGNANTLAFIAGIFVSQILALPQLFGTEDLWPLVLGATAIPALFQLFALPFCPESPKYLLIAKRKRREANEALLRLRKSSHVSVEMNLMLEEAGKSALIPVSENPISQSFWWGMTICIVNHIAQQFSGSPSLLYFSSTIFREQGQMEHEESVGATLGMGAILLVSCLISTIIIDRVGRRILMLTGVAGTCIFDIMIFISLHLLAIDREKYFIASYCAVIFVYLYYIAFAIGPVSIPWFYVSELFDQSSRGKANMIAATTNRMSAFIVGYTFLPLKDAMREYVFLFYATIAAFCFVFLYFAAPETKGRQVHEINKELEARTPNCCRQN